MLLDRSWAEGERGGMSMRERPIVSSALRGRWDVSRLEKGEGERGGGGSREKEARGMWDV